MSYKRKALKLSQLPNRNKKQSLVRTWANAILDDFWSSDDEAWQILEDEYGNPITDNNITRLATILRYAETSKEAKNEIDGRIKVSTLKGGLYIYAEDVY